MNCESAYHSEPLVGHSQESLVGEDKNEQATVERMKRDWVALVVDLDLYTGPATQSSGSGWQNWIAEVSRTRLVALRDAPPTHHAQVVHRRVGPLQRCCSPRDSAWQGTRDDARRLLSNDGSGYSHVSACDRLRGQASLCYSKQTEVEEYAWERRTRLPTNH